MNPSLVAAPPLTLEPQLLERVGQALSGVIGLQFPPDKYSDLERGLHSAAADFGFAKAEPFAQWLQVTILSPEQIGLLAGHLTIGETFFFRDSAAFQALEAQVLPALLKEQSDKSKRLVIWSAGCATGEEPYSLAILLHRLGVFQEGWDVRILGTDLNPSFLHTAEDGSYGNWSFRNAPPWLKTDCFVEEKPGHWRILPVFRERVRFASWNLASPNFPFHLLQSATVHLLLCRNVMIYLTETARAQAATLFQWALADNGWLVTSPTETSANLARFFRPILFDGFFGYQKSSSPETGTSIAAFVGTGSTAVDDGSRRGGFQTRPLDSSRQLNSPRQGVLPKTPQVSPALRPPLHPPHAVYREKSPYLSTGLQDSVLPQAEELAHEMKYGEAVAILRADLNLEREPRALTLLARCLVNQGEKAEALQWCRKAVLQDKLDPRTQYLLATILIEQGEQEEAFAVLRKALYLDPGFVLAHYMAGNLQLEAGQTQKARRHFQQALGYLERYAPDETLPEGSDLTVGRWLEIIAPLAVQEEP